MVCFTKELTDITVRELNGKTKLQCEISKDGLRVEWYKGDKKLRRGEDYDIIVEGRIHSLVIEKTGLDHAGQYTAKYEQATTTASVLLCSEFHICLAQHATV